MKTKIKYIVLFYSLIAVLIIFPKGLSAAAVNQKLSGTTTMGGGSTTVTLCSSVDLSTSILLFTISNNSNVVGNNLVSGELTNSTTLTFRRDGTGATVAISWQVIEFSSGVSVQRGSTNVNASTTNQAITAVADLTETFPIISMQNNGSTMGNDDGVIAELTSTTNLQFRCSNANFTAYWQVVEYDSCDVQTFSISLPGTTATDAISAINTSKTMLLSSHYMSTNVNADDLPRLELTNSTTITATRVGSAATITLFGYAIEFEDETEVQHGNFSFSSGQSSNNQTITAVQTDRSIVFGTGNFGHQGSTDHTSDDNIGHNWTSMTLTNGTTVNASREATTSAANIPFEVVSFRFDQTAPPSGSDLTDPTGPFNNIFLNRKETGTITMAANATSTTASITSVDVDSTFFIFSINIGTNEIGQATVRGELTNSTTLTFERQNTGAAVTIEWQVFYFATGVYVQHGTTNMNATSVDETIISVDLEKSFVIPSFQNVGVALGSDDAIVADLTSSTNLQLRSVATLGDDASWQVIEMQDALVRKVEFTLDAGETADTVSISSVSGDCGSIPINAIDTAHSFVVSSHTLDANLNSDDLAWLQITDTNELIANRVGSTGNLDFVAYVVELFDGSEVVRGSVSMTGTDNTGTATIIAVNPIASGVIGSSNLGRQGRTDLNSDDNMGYPWAALTLNSSTEVGAARSVSIAATSVIPYQVFSFANFRTIPLPITLASFSLSKIDEQFVQVNWQTISEINNDYFTVERSADAINWETITTINGAGNSTIRNSYQFIDKHPLEGTAYYRLKQTDYDGHFEYFAPKEIKLAMNYSKILVYPNPMEYEVFIEGVTLSKEVQIFNTKGRIVNQSIQKNMVDDNTVRLNISKLEKGVYFIRVNDLCKKVIKL